MNLQERKEALIGLGRFMASDDEGWKGAKQKATAENPWFIPEFIELSITSICREYLTTEALDRLIERYELTDNEAPKKLGIVMAGNLPLVGLHDLLCTFITGHYAAIKLSSKDDALLRFLIDKLIVSDNRLRPYFTIAERLLHCDAYIATGSNNTSGYFDYYFGKYPHIIRRNRTSVAILTGTETDEEINALADDVYQYFGLGCRNVTKLYVPAGYNFERLINFFKKYDYLSAMVKYKNNYDYNLAIHLLNRTYFMSNESLLLIEDASIFSPISQLNYEYYKDTEAVKAYLLNTDSVQCIVGTDYTPFGQAQSPGIDTFADGVDTIAFLKAI